MGVGRTWSEEDKTYLEDNYGMLSIKTLSKNLDRSENGIAVMKTRLKLGAFLDNGDYVTYSQLLMALFGADNPYNSYRQVNKMWADFPIKYKRVNNGRFKVVYLEDFWKWAEKNKRKIDFSKMEENILGKEPDWAKKKRKIDFDCRRRTSPWSKAEDLMLERMLEQNKYTYTDIQTRLNRSEDAIRRRIWDLAIDIKPVRAKTQKWTSEEELILSSMYEEGWSIDKIGEKLGRTGQSVRGKLQLLQNPDIYLRKNRNPKE